MKHIKILDFREEALATKTSKKKKAGFLSIGYSRSTRYFGLITMLASIYSAYKWSQTDIVWWQIALAIPILLALGKLFMAFEVHWLWRGEREADFETHPSKKEFELIKAQLEKINARLDTHESSKEALLCASRDDFGHRVWQESVQKFASKEELRHRL